MQVPPEHRYQNHCLSRRHLFVSAAAALAGAAWVEAGFGRRKGVVEADTLIRNPEDLTIVDRENKTHRIGPNGDRFITPQNRNIPADKLDQYQREETIDMTMWDQLPSVAQIVADTTGNTELVDIVKRLRFLGENYYVTDDPDNDPRDDTNATNVFSLSNGASFEETNPNSINVFAPSIGIATSTYAQRKEINTRLSIRVLSVKDPFTTIEPLMSLYKQYQRMNICWLNIFKDLGDDHYDPQTTIDRIQTNLVS